MEGTENNNTDENLLELFNVTLGVDIDIAHKVPFRHNGQKLVIVCKFVLRKSKLVILEKKKDMHVIKFNNHSIYIKDHLSPSNRELLYS